MSHFYSLVSTYKDGERDTFYEEKQLPDRLLSIGWGEVNPINKTIAEIKYLIELFYPDFVGTTNPHNGSISLHRFANLEPGDIIFVRGQKKIIDVVVITDYPFFDTEGHYDDDYFLKVPFRPLFENIRTTLLTAKIPGNIYYEVLFSEGRSMPLREVDESLARILLEEILKLMPRVEIPEIAPVILG